MTREQYAIELLRKARRVMVEGVVDAVIENDHLTRYGELPTFDDSLTDTGEKLIDLNRLIWALEDATAIEVKPVPEPTPPVNPLVTQIIA